MSNHRVVILQDNTAAIEKLTKAVNEMDGFNVVGSSTDGEQGLEIINAEKPEFIIIGLILQNLDGFAVLEKLKQQNISSKIIAISSYANDEIITKTLNYGATYYIVKPYKIEILKTRLSELVNFGSNVAKSEKQLSTTPQKNILDEKLEKLFAAMEIPHHIKAYYFLHDGVKMAIAEPAIIYNATKRLYPKLAEKHSTTVSKVEKILRNALKNYWNMKKYEEFIKR